MPIEIRMPRLVDSMTHGGLVAWRKGEGEKVRTGEVIAEIEADKTTVDLESPCDGTIERILMPAGTEKVEVGTLLAVLADLNDISSSQEGEALSKNEEGNQGRRPNRSTNESPNPSACRTMAMDHRCCPRRS